MIVRIVKLTLIKAEVGEFLRIFNARKDQIRNATGCTKLDLLHDENDPLIYYTYSVWESESDLENYRNSELFLNTWTIVKGFFLSDPKAQSFKVISSL